MRPPGFSAERFEHLRTVLELERQPDGSARGEIDGSPIALSARGELSIPIAGDWPEAVADLRPKHRRRFEWARRFVNGARLGNRSRHRAWTNEVFSRPALRALLGALEVGEATVQIHDRSLRFSWSREPDGPVVRHFVRCLIQIAELLPAERTNALDEAASQLRGRTASARPTRPATTIAPGTDPAEVLYFRLQSARTWQRVGLVGLVACGGLAIIALCTRMPLAGLPALGFAVPLLGLVGTSFLAYRKLRHLRCPGCQAPLAEPVGDSSVQRDAALRSGWCTRCGLEPRRPRARA